MKDLNTTNYNTFISEIIFIINSARYNAFKSVNKHHIGLNFEIGKQIVINQEKFGWGKSIVNSMSNDINKIIDGIKGYSPQNLWKMRKFYLEYKDEIDLYKMAFNIPWGQNMLIIHKVKNKDERTYYTKLNTKCRINRLFIRHFVFNLV